MDATAITAALLTPEGRADPYPLYARAHELGSVLKAGDGWYLVAGYAAASQVLRSPAFAPAAQESRPDTGQRPALALMTRSILEAGPEAHGRMRPAIAAAFTPRRIADLEPAIAAAADTLLDRLAAAGGEPVDFMEEFAYQLTVTVICELLGVPPGDRGRFRVLASDLTAALELLPGEDRLDVADAAASELGDYLTRMIAARRAAPRDDLVSALAGARLPDEELLANLILLLVAGFETTTDLLGNGTALLLDQPHTAAALRSGTIPAAGFTDEVLRYESPVQLTTRQALAAGQVIDGSPVPPGARLIVLIGAANRDPARYSRPGVFDPARAGSKPLSFGAGPHVCLGNALARLEAAIAFPRLLARFSRLVPAPGAARTRHDRLTLRGYHTLPVTTGALRSVGHGPLIAERRVGVTRHNVRGEVTKLPGGVAAHIVQQVVRLLGEPEPLFLHLLALAALGDQVQRATGRDTGTDVAGDVGVVTADQFGTRAHVDTDNWQHDEVNAQQQQEHHVRLAGQYPGNPLQDPVEARSRFLIGKVIGRAEGSAQAIGAVFHRSAIFG